ncbi:TIGR01244 family sulfur transferase [Methylobacterium planeticum]|uniref:TIGR01244 family phosphatase n=1 Tax=Methylobacterium planeticum TaxID=2615211 RepID=A0A6N6MI51_9HYPH|nr:TIGR01244 family sulfur transferase [Methylobacterium planeticum]KAB1069604.1 TIGR01244 family phosphatase [Methylobacterium planeticum]
MIRTEIAPGLTVAGQPNGEDIAGLAAAGYALLINNRPDGEEAGQPGSEAERESAEAAGLAYRHLPVTGATITRAEIENFRDAVAGASGPVLAHCRSGTRSLTLWVLGEVLAGRMRRADVLPFGAARGFDLTGAVGWLNAHAPETDDRPGASA